MSTFNTFLDIKEAACELAQRDPSLSTDLTAAGLAVNQVYLQVLGSGDPWAFLRGEGQVVLTAGTAVYNVNGTTSISSTLGLGTDGIELLLGIVIDSEDASGRPLASMGWTDLEYLARSTEDDDAQDAPKAWAVTGSQIRFFPTPDEAYTIGVHYRAKGSAMSADADVPLIPAGYRRPVLAVGAAAILVQQEGGAEARSEAGVLRNEMRANLDDMRIRHATPTSADDFRLVSPGFHGELEGSWQEIDL